MTSQKRGPEVHFFLLLVNRPTKNLDRTIKDGDEASILTCEEQRFTMLLGNEQHNRGWEQQLRWLFILLHNESHENGE